MKPLGSRILESVRRLETEQLAIIIMVSTRSYPDLDQYRSLVQKYASYEEFYRNYARGGSYFDADRSDIELHFRCYEETKAVYWCVTGCKTGLCSDKNGLAKRIQQYRLRILELLMQRGLQPKTVLADAGYDSKENYRLTLK